MNRRLRHRASAPDRDQIFVLYRRVRIHEQRPRDPISQTGPLFLRRLIRTCFLSSQMNAIGGFSAPLSGVRRSHQKMSSRQKQETPSSGLSGTHYMAGVENVRAGPKPRAQFSCLACLSLVGPT